MYQILSERHGSNYSKTFSDQKAKYREKTDAFEKKNESLKYDIKIVEKEIEYLEELLK